MEYKDVVHDVLLDHKRCQFLRASLQESMTYLGFSESLIDEFLNNITDLDLDVFITKHRKELARVQLGHFFDELVPKYFEKYIIPEVPFNGKILDLGCGRGTLIQCLIDRAQNDEYVGIDITKSPEWDELANKNIHFEVVQEKDFLSFLKKEQPDHVTITWVLHHMEYDAQKRYLSALFNVLKEGATLVVLEDAYSEILPPEDGRERYEKFITWSKEDRLKIMGAYDWIANRVFSMRTTMPVPFAYRTLEEWKQLFQEVGFRITKTRFIGLPLRDVNTAQSVFVATK